MNRRTGKRLADRVNDRIVASVLGVDGWPQANDAAIASAASDAIGEAPRTPANFNCVVREIVNGAVRASRFTHLPTADAVRATMAGIVQGAKRSGGDMPAIASLACERLLWSTAALDEDLATCARGIVEGAKEGSAGMNGHRAPLLELVIASALRAVRDIDADQVEPTRRAIAA